MDERKLAELFNDAVPDVPPPSFDYDDVAAESGRQRTRRRNALMGGSALGIAVLAGATVLGVALWKGTDAGSSSSGQPVPAIAGGSGGSGNGEVPLNETPSDGSGRTASGTEQQPDKNVPPGLPKQGGTSAGQPAPTGAGSTSSGCGQADVELAAALAGELPSAASSPALHADIPCPAGMRGVALRVDGGIISLLVGPIGTQFDDPYAGQPPGTTLRAASTTDGRMVVLVSEPPAGSTDAPRKDDLQGIADRLAASAKF